MTALSAYSWWKPLHVASALVFVAGMSSVAGFMQLCGFASTNLKVMAATGRRWDRQLTTPAMLLVWAFGPQSTGSGGWFGRGWSQLKMLIVVMSSGLREVHSGRLRWLSLGTAVAPAGRPWMLLEILLGISILGALKHF